MFFQSTPHLAGPNVEMFQSWSLAGLTRVTAILFRYLEGCSKTELSWQQSHNTWFGMFHTIIMDTDIQCQLMGIASLAQVCKAEEDAGNEVNSDHSCSLQAFRERSFSFLLPALQKAVQVLASCLLTQLQSICL